MAIELGQGTENYTEKWRSWRIEIFTDNGAEPVIKAHRERVRILDSGTVLRLETVAVERKLSEIAAEIDQGVTGAQLAGLIASRADLWHQQELDKRAPQS